MAARATVFNNTRLGVEVVKGTAVQAVRRLPATGFTLKPVVPIEPFTPMGSKYPTTAVKGKEHTEGDIEGTLAFNDMLYLAAGVLEFPTTTTPAGASLTRRHTFKPKTFSPDDYITYTAEMGSEVRAERAAYTILNGITLRITKEEAAITGSLLAHALEESFTLSTGRNEVQTVSRGTHTGGTFTLDFEGQVTANIAFDATAGAVQTALEALSNIAPGDVVVTGPAGGPWVVTFQGLLGSSDRTQMIIDGTLLTGGSGEAVTTTTEGMALLDVPEVPCDADQFTLYVGDSLANEVQVVTVQATGGTFTLTFHDQFGNSATTAAIPEGAAAATVQTELEALNLLNTGDVTVTGSAGGPFTVTFGGRYAGVNLPLMTYNDNLLTGITLPAISIVQSTPGGLTILDKAMEFEWAMDDRFTPRFDIRADNDSFSEEVEKAPGQNLELIMEHDSTAAAFMAAMRAKQSKYLRMEVWGPLIETVGVNDYYHRMSFTWPFKFTDNDRGDQDDSWGSTFELTPVHDPVTLGAVMELVIENKLAGLEA